jgi:hypothetical protein
VRRTNPVPAFLLLFVCALLTACGGGGSGANGNGGQSAGPSVPTAPSPKFSNMKILVLGQSIASNCNEHLYGPVENVFQIARDGSTKPAQDPFEWADCVQGSMWMPLGKKLISNGVAINVTFMPIGVAGTPVRAWQAGGSAYEKLNNAIALVKKQGITFNYAFWLQGSADIGLDKDEYLNRLASVVDYVNSNVKIDRWVIAMHSRCSGSYDPNIEMAQRRFGDASASRRYLGPNMNSLGNEYRGADACHLNERGQEEMASLWLEAVQNSLK